MKDLFRISPDDERVVQVKVAGVWFDLQETRYSTKELVDNLNREINSPVYQ